MFTYFSDIFIILEALFIVSLFVTITRVFSRVKSNRRAWNYSKLYLKKKTIDTKEKLIDNSIELFLESTSTDLLYKTTVNKFIPQLI